MQSYIQTRVYCQYSQRHYKPSFKSITMRILMFMQKFVNYKIRICVECGSIQVTQNQTSITCRDCGDIFIRFNKKITQRLVYLDEKWITPPVEHTSEYSTSPKERSWSNYQPDYFVKSVTKSSRQHRRLKNDSIGNK